MSTSILYGFQCPFGAPDTKSGINKVPNAEIRLGVYQNSFSSRSHKAQFDWAFYGDSGVIEKLEATIKKNFDWDIEKEGRGHSEWIWNHDSQMVKEKVEEIIEGYHYKVLPIPSNFFPVNLDNVAELQEWLDKQTQ
jgi:hypothetical protein